MRTVKVKKIMEPGDILETILTAIAVSVGVGGVLFGLVSLFSKNNSASNS